MAERLPTHGEANWDTILNGYLGVSLDSAGVVKTAAISATQIAAGAVTGSLGYVPVNKAGDTFATGSGATYMVAASNAATRVKNQADYLCDGTADEVEINAALTAAGDDGHVILSEGLFTTAAPILMQNQSQRLTGAAWGSAANAFSASQGTRIKALSSGFVGSYVLSVGPAAGEVQPVGYNQISNFTIDAASASGLDGIRWTCYSGTAQSVKVCRARDGWTFKGATGAASWNLYDCNIIGCHSFDNSRDGFVLGVNATDMHFAFCIGGRNGQDGWHVTGGSGGLYYGNHMYDSTRYNGHLEGAGSYSAYTACRFDNNQQHGVVISPVLGNVYIVRFIGCWFNRAGLATNNTYDHVYSPGSGGSGFFADGIMLEGCQFFWQGSGNKGRYAVNLVSGWARNWQMRGCYFEPNAFATSPVNDGGTNNFLEWNDANLRYKMALTSGASAGYQIGTASSQLLGFWGATPIARPSAYTPTNVTTDRSYDANSTSIDELSDVLGTLIADLQTIGLIG